MTMDASNQLIDGTTTRAHNHEPAKPKKKRKRYRSRGVRFTIGLLRIIAFGYVAILVTLVLMESRFVYPGAYFVGDRDIGTANVPGIETVEYGSTDGITLRGRLLDRAGSPDIVLFFHGNGEKARWLDDWLVLLSDEFNATVMIAEYRGYEDDSTPGEKGVLADCFAARDYLCERFDKSPTDIILYGRSLGGGCAVALASQGGAKALILERTFDRLVNVAAGQYPFIPVRWLMKNRYDSIAKMTVYKGPLVVIHGMADKLIPVHHGETLFESAGCPRKHWVPVTGMGHNDSLPLESLREVAARIREFTTTP